MMFTAKQVHDLCDMFGQRAGSEIATRTTYLPTGKVITSADTTILCRNGCRTFPASDFDWMLDWMAQYAPQDLISIYLAKEG